MTVSYQGKSPGKIWYFWQKTKGIFATKQQKPLVQSSAGTGISGASTYLLTQQIGFVTAYLPFGLAALGAMAAYQALRAIRPSESDRKNRISSQERWVSAAKYAGVTVGAAVLTPMLTSWVSIAAVAATGYFGLRSWRSWQEGAKSMSVRNYIREREAAWLDHKQNGGIKNALKRAKAALKRASLKTGKWGGFTAAAAGLVAGGIAAAQYAGAAILPAAVQGSVLGTIATAGAAIGIGATAAVYGVAALVVAAVPAGIITGLICRNKLREGAAANDNGPARKRIYKPLSDDITADVRKAAPAPQTPVAAPANDFNTQAPKAAPAQTSTAAAKPAPAKAPQDPERQRAAEERARARARGRKPGK